MHYVLRSSCACIRLFADITANLVHPVCGQGRPDRNTGEYFCMPGDETAFYYLQGYSPLMCACEENKPQIVKVLLEQGASVVYKGKVYSSILVLACN